MTSRDTPASPVLIIEFLPIEIDFGTSTLEHRLEEKFKLLCQEKLNTRVSSLGLEWPPADIWRAEINIGRTNDTVWSYIQTVRDDILKLYKEVRND